MGFFWSCRRKITVSLFTFSTIVCLLYSLFLLKDASNGWRHLRSIRVLGKLESRLPSYAVLETTTAVPEPSAVVSEYGVCTSSILQSTSSKLPAPSPQGGTITKSDAVADFCKRHPELKNQLINYRHMFYNDRFKIMYCYVPKDLFAIDIFCAAAGCSNIKFLMAVLNNVFPANKTQPRNTIHDAPAANKFRMSALPPKEREKRMRTYYKFVITRDPLVRMLSAYVDKLAVSLQDDKIFEVTIKKEVQNLFVHKYAERKVLKQKDPLRQASTANSNSFPPPFQPFSIKGRTVFYLPFEMYLDYYMKDTKFGDMNEHFAPIHHLCTPCALNYDYYGNLKSLNDDMNAIMSDTGIPKWMFNGTREHSTFSVDKLLNLYFADMSTTERTSLERQLEEETGFAFVGTPSSSVDRGLLRAVFNHFKTELDFYYTLFPEDTRKDKLYS